MTERQARWLVLGGIVLLAVLFAAIVSPGVLLPAIVVGVLASLIAFAALAANDQTQKPPTPVYKSPTQPAESEQPSLSPTPSYTQGYQVQQLSPPSAPGWSPFGVPPSKLEPQPHQDRPGTAPTYEQPLVMYPEIPPIEHQR